MFYISTGTIHAIGAGCMIYEIQQSSNLTYRVYDFGRLDKDGNPRELHIGKAIDVAKLDPNEKGGKPQGSKKETDDYMSNILVSNEYFTAVEHEIKKSEKFYINETSFDAFIVIEGEGSVICGGDIFDFKAGDSFYIDANTGGCIFKGKSKIIQTYI